MKATKLSDYTPFDAPWIVEVDLKTVTIRGIREVRLNC
ncbi:MAG: hypothetical protein ACI8SI_001845 [Congregibacter sp.]|jgi:hypothetical protein